VAEETVVEQPKQPEKKSANGILNILLIILLALASSAGGGVLSWYLLSKTVAHSEGAGKTGEGKQAEGEHMAEILEKGAVVPLEPFVVNLADAEVPRYLRIKISLMVDDKTQVGEVNENMALQLKVRDVILQTLTAKTSQQLIHEEGKNHLRREILEKVGGFFRVPKLVDVMFTEFVIQL
jgi:flagellar FliL protein